ncbi:MAG: 3-phosphoserine/phosphohydroxythreonine transaminase [Pelosinus sp.]|nr:3-phosphoserine/phosphohydroxythreonine transaminase [Pelosinus sp.]
MTDRIFNFNPGPAVLPLEVLEEAQKELLNFQNTGMSVLEISHRSKPFIAVSSEAEANLKELLGVGDNYKVLFLQGGASTQFSMIPMNFLPKGRTADYVVTGSFADKAHKEAAIIGNTHIAASSKDNEYRNIPKFADIHLSDNPAYVHITSNNTIYGTEWAELPTFGNVPLIADMSSDILSRQFDANNYALIYAGAQKNLGPSGVTVVIIREDMLAKCPKDIPTMLRYSIHAEKDSMYNTPPTFSIYLLNLVLKWVKAQGGVAALEKINQQKAKLIYDCIDQNPDFYRGHAEKGSRSLMNITLRLPSEELEKAFIAEATKAGLGGVKGHRSVGGLRFSIYNAMPVAGCQALSDFMTQFQRKNG